MPLTERHLLFLANPKTAMLQAPEHLSNEPIQSSHKGACIF